MDVIQEERSQLSLAERFIKAQNTLIPEGLDFAQGLWSYLAESMEEEVVSCLEKEVDEKDAFLAEQLEAWEIQYLESPYQARKALVDAWAYQSSDPSIWEELKSLWRRRQFDSVTKSYITLHTIAIRADHTIPGMPEKDFISTFSDVGRTTMNAGMLLELDWGVDFSQAHAVRGKINGLSFVKTQKGDQEYFLSGSFDLGIPVDFPVEKAEFYGGDFYIIYPYGIPSFRYIKDGKEYQFLEHKWLHPLDFRDQIQFEGVMVLCSDRELRTKKLPTFEICLDGQTWECAIVNSQGGQVTNLRRLRPRPGKAVSYPYSTLMDVTSGQLREFFPKKRLYDVLTVSSGSLEMNFSVRGKGEKKTFVIDSGFRVDLVRKIPLRPSMVNVPLMKHVREMRYDESSQLLQGEIASTGKKFYTPHNITTVGDAPKISFVGSKGIICDHMFVYLISDEGKPLDFLGGSKEGSETPVQTFLRESREETGVCIDPKEVFPLGVSDTDEVGVFARSFLFGMYMRVQHPLRAFLVGIPIDSFVLNYNGSEYQPWVGRIMNHVLQQVGSIVNLSMMLRAYRGFDFGEICNIGSFMKVDGSYPSMIKKVILLNEKMRHAASVKKKFGLAVSLYEVQQKGTTDVIERMLQTNIVASSNKSVISDQECLKQLYDLCMKKFGKPPVYVVGDVKVDCSIKYVSVVRCADNSYTTFTPSNSKILAKRTVARIALQELG